jgi:hypothetical protein
MASVPDSQREARAVEHSFVDVMTVASVGFTAWLSGLSLLLYDLREPKGHYDPRIGDVGVGLIVSGYAMMFALPVTSIQRDEHLYRAIGQNNAAALRSEECPVRP